MQIYVINLERSLDRRQSMQAQFEKNELEANFYKAVNGSTLDEKWKSRTCSDGYNKLMGNPGFSVNNEIACFASHFCLWNLCIEKNENFIILEDDIGIKPDFKARLPTIEKLVNHLGYLRLMALEHKDGFFSVSDELICYKHFPCGTQGYAISPSGAAKLISNAARWTEPVDMYLDKFWIHGLRPYCINPELITHLEEVKSLISENGARKSQYLSKPKGILKLLRELIIRPYQKHKMKSFELKNPLITKAKVQEWLK